METAEHWSRLDIANGLQLATHGGVPIQALMRARLVVVAGILIQHPAQVPFTQREDVVDAFPADRSDDSFDEGFLPGRTRRDPQRPGSERPHLPHELPAVDGCSPSVPRARIMYLATVVSPTLCPSSRQVHLVGGTTSPDDAFMAQVARNLTDVHDGFLRRHRLLICDRDSKFTAQFQRILGDEGVRVVLTPRQAPNCNAFAERFVLSIKSECLNPMIFFGESSLRRAIREYLRHYHRERAHQGIGNQRLRPSAVGGGEVQCRERLGGILKCHRRAA